MTAAASDAATRGTHCILFGPADQIRPALGGAAAGIEVVDAPEEITNFDDPVQAVRSKPGASIAQAARALGEGRADAVVTTGSSGAALAASLVHVKRLRGVYRPALAVVVPVPGRRLLLLDVGANVEVRPEHLVQFAFMGAAFSHGVLGVPRPRVGLLSIGEEAGKGTADVVAAHERLSSLAGAPFEFAGNVEGFDLARGEADVVVTDGFTGNVALKTLEATAKTVVGAIRDAIRSGTVSKLGGLLVRHKLTPLRESFEPRNPWAAPTCSACAGWWWCATATRPGARSRTRSRSPSAGWRRRSCGGPPTRSRPPASCVVEKPSMPRPWPLIASPSQ